MGLLTRLSYASSAKIVQALTPLLLYPYFVKILGVDGYGIILYWLSLAAFLSNIIGLNVEGYASRMVYQAETQRELALAVYVPIVMKLGIGVFFLLIWVLVSFFIADDIFEFLLIVFSVHPLLVVSLIPTHFVTGLGKFKALFVGVLIEKLLLVALVLVILDDKNEAFLLPLIYFFSTAISALYFYVFVIGYLIKSLSATDFNVPAFRPYYNVAVVLVLGKVTQVHTNGGKFLLGSLVDAQYIVYFDLAEKVVNMLKLPFSIVSQALFSYSIKNYHLCMVVLWSMSLVLLFGLNGLGRYIASYFLAGEVNQLAVDSLRYLGVILLFTPIILVFGFNYIVKHGHAQAYGYLLVVSNVMSIVLMCFLYFFNFLTYYAFLGWVVFAEGVLAVMCLGWVVFFEKKTS